MTTLNEHHEFIHDNRRQLVGVAYPVGSSEEFVCNLGAERTDFFPDSSVHATNTTLDNFGSGTRFLMKQGPSTTKLSADDGAGRLPPRFVNGQYRAYAYDGADVWHTRRRRVAALPNTSDASAAFLACEAAPAAVVPRMGVRVPALPGFTRTIATVLATREV